MSRIKCVLCGNNKGKRPCKINNDAFVCPVCCAKIRNSSCNRCVFYITAEKHRASKKASVANHSSKKEFFIAEFDEEVENKVDAALQLVEQGNIRKAEERLMKLLHTYPQNQSVLYGLGTCNVMRDRLDKGIEYFDKALRIFPYFVEAEFNRAEAYRQKKNIRKAYFGYKRVLEIGAHDNICVTQAQTFLFDFERITQDAFNISAGEYFHAWDLFDEGWAAMDRHDWDEAIGFFADSTKVNPHIPQPYSNGALCYAYIGEKEMAIALCKLAIEADPDYEIARINLEAFEKLSPGEYLSPDNMLETGDYTESFE